MGSADVRPPAELVTPALARYIADRVPGFSVSQPVIARLFHGGRSNLTYRLSQGDQVCVLRRPPLSPLAPGAHDMAREYRVLNALADYGLPVPTPLAYCDDPGLLGAPFLLMQYVPGRTLAVAADAAGLSSADAHGISAAVVHTLVALHGIDPAGAGLGDLGRGPGFLERQTARWQRQWAGQHNRPLPSAQALIDGLQRRLPAVAAAARPTLIHNDFRLDNLILTLDATEVSAVLDWEMATIGDPVMDLATLLVYWSQSTDRLRRRVPVAAGVTCGPGFWSRRRLVEAYVQATGVGVDHLDFCIALSCLKLGVVFEAIYRSAATGMQQGVAAREQEAFSDGVPALFEMGISVLRGRGLEGLGD